MINLSDKYLVRPGQAFDRINLRLRMEYRNDEGYFIDLTLQNNVDDDIINMELEVGTDIQEGIRMLVEALIEKLAWEQEDE